MRRSFFAEGGEGKPGFIEDKLSLPLAARIPKHAERKVVAQEKSIALTRASEMQIVTFPDGERQAPTCETVRVVLTPAVWTKSRIGESTIQASFALANHREIPVDPEASLPAVMVGIVAV